jgi:hypothetical protein
VAYLICGLLTAVVADVQEYRLEKSEGVIRGQMIFNLTLCSIGSLFFWPPIIALQVGLYLGLVPNSPGGVGKAN